jgi:predicted DCC family thiol-disulfide oxidoreductase YuxK
MTHAVIYDGNCGICSAIVARLVEWDKAGILELIASQSPEVPRRFAWISPGAFKQSLQVVRLSDNRTWQGAAAVEELLNVLPRGRAISWLFHIPFARGLAERSYRAFARNRHRLGCRDHCRTG